MRRTWTIIPMACVGVLLAGCGTNDLEAKERASALSRIRTAVDQLTHTRQLVFMAESTENDGQNGPPESVHCMKGQWKNHEDDLFDIEAVFEVSDSTCDSPATMTYQLTGTRLYLLTGSADPTWRRATISPSLITTTLSVSTSAADSRKLLDHVTGVRKLGKQKFDALEHPDGINYLQDPDEIDSEDSADKGMTYELRVPFSAWLKLFPGSLQHDNAVIKKAKKVKVTITVRLDDNNRLRDFDVTLRLGDLIYEINSTYGSYDAYDRSGYSLVPPRNGKTSRETVRLQTIEHLKKFLNGDQKRAD